MADSEAVRPEARLGMADSEAVDLEVRAAEVSEVDVRCTTESTSRAEKERTTPRPQSWLQGLRDYLAGRSIDLDAILNWAESQTSEIPQAPNCGVHEFPMFDQIPVELKEQLWAFLGPLVASESNQTSTFKSIV